MKNTFCLNLTILLVLIVCKINASATFPTPKEIDFNRREYVSLECNDDGTREFTFNNIEELLVGEDPNGPMMTVSFVDENSSATGSLKGENDLDNSLCRQYIMLSPPHVITLSGGDFNKCAYEYTNGSSAGYISLKYKLRVSFDNKGSFMLNNPPIFQLECQFQSNITEDVLVATVVPVKHNDTNLEEVSFNMDASLNLFTDDTFVSKLAESFSFSLYSEYTLEDTLYLELTVPNANTDIDYSLYTQTCTATVRGSGTEENLIENGCPVTDLVKVLSREKTYSRYSLEVFMFKESVGNIGSDNTIVTVKCSSTICIPINGAVCPSQNTCSKKTKRFINEDQKFEPAETSVEFKIKSTRKNKEKTTTAEQLDPQIAEIYRPKITRTETSDNHLTVTLFISSNILLNIACILSVLKILKKKCFKSKENDKMVLLADEISINLSECSDGEKEV